MIIFNGKDLTETFDVKIEDIVVSPVRLQPVARQRTISPGEEFVRQKYGTRNVTISFALLEQNLSKREQTMQKLRNWAKTDTEQTLSLPEFTNRHLECICTQQADYSYRKWWENKLRFVFTCFNNPFWTSDELIEVKCGKVFSVGGNVQPLMTIERTGTSALTDQEYTMKNSTMKFTSIPAGNLIIDLNRQTAAVDGSSIMKFYDPASKWIVPKVGANQQINGVGSVKYRERWA